MNMITDENGDWDVDGIVRVLVNPSPATLARKVAALLATLRRDKTDLIKAEAVRRMALVIPELDDIEKIKLLVSLWPVLNNPAGNVSLTKVRNIYLYARQKIIDLAAADLATVKAYDPANDAGWPV